MIIVSQSKRMILNFDNALGLGISSLEDKSIAIKMYESIDKIGTTIARYKTEKRALEVLEEIATAFATTELLKSPQLRVEGLVNGKDFLKVLAYQMPEE